MSDELERRLRAAADSLPGPNDDETALARERFLAASAQPRRRPVLAFAVAVVAVAVAFGGGYAIASSTQDTAEPEPRAQLNAGPGFLPAEGWDVVATGTTAPPQAPTAVAANIRLSDEDRSLRSPPRATARRLGPNGVLFYVIFYPAGATGTGPERLLPLQLRDAEEIGSFEGMPPVGSTRRLLARTGRYDLDVLVFFGATEPAAGVVASAAQQLARLAVPACPAALPLTESDLPRAEAFVLRWLGSHYQEDPADLTGARAEAALGTEMPRGDAARVACGEDVRQRTVEVDIVLPRLERISASLSQLSYFVSRTSGGWVVWQRIH